MHDIVKSFQICKIQVHCKTPWLPCLQRLRLTILRKLIVDSIYLVCEVSSDAYLQPDGLRNAKPRPRSYVLPLAGGVESPTGSFQRIRVSIIVGQPYDCKLEIAQHDGFDSEVRSFLLSCLSRWRFKLTGFYFGGLISPRVFCDWPQQPAWGQTRHTHSITRV